MPLEIDKDPLSNLLSVEADLRLTLRRLWTHGKREDVIKLLKHAQLSISLEELDSWVKMDDGEWRAHQVEVAQLSDSPRVHAPDVQSQVHLSKTSQAQDKLDSKPPQRENISAESIELSRDSLSIDHETTLSQKLGLKHNTPRGRHKVGDEIARGGVGRVLASRDRQLQRSQVMKVLNQGVEATQKVMLNFIREAQITAQLEHPNIVPVHDLGLRANGEVFFTMKRIRGQTLKEIVRSLRREDPVVTKNFPRVKLLEIFKSICFAAAFAHSRGVLHRDLKPSNVMVGDFGEVLVLDWGIALVFRDPEIKRPIRAPEGDGVGRSAIVGTPAYMSPEQAIGDTHRVDHRSDIYSLGAILYEILTCRPPYRGKDPKTLLEMAIKGNPIPPREFRPQFHIPHALNDIVMKCLSKSRSGRYVSVNELIDDIRNYLTRLEELDRRIKLSHARYQEALLELEGFNKIRQKLTISESALIELEWSTPAFASADDRRPLWKQRAEIRSLKFELHNIYRQAERSLMSALSLYSDHQQAKSDLAYLYSVQLESAEERREHIDTTHYQTLLKLYNNGDYDEQLSAHGRVQVRTTPPKSEVYASRGMEVDISLQFLQERPWGQAPFNAPRVPEGPWRLRLTAPGHTDVIYPLVVKRGKLVEVDCPLYRPETIGDGFCYIPRGEIMLGGDPVCPTSKTQRLVHIKGFAISKYLVTCEEYLLFLNSIACKDSKEAALHAPRVEGLEFPLWPLGEDELYSLPVPTELMPWSPRWPIFGISMVNAKRYCEWWSRVYQEQVRLPTEDEWEKAARSGDERQYPWGHFFDPAFCHIAEGRSHIPRPIEVGRTPDDQSPFGVFDMAGLVHEFCDTPFLQGHSDRVLKGGSFETHGAIESRGSYRKSISPFFSSYSAGFRLAKNLPR